MAYYRLYTFFLLLFCSIGLAHSANQIHHVSLGHQFVREREDQVTTNISLGAPYHRSISAGEAWMIPTDAVDIAARALECQCFNPDETCCLAKSKDVAPFCVPRNSTCCSDTFCGPGETCCGDACCPSETVCTFNQFTAGCCPKGQLCSGPAICYDHASPNCTNNFVPLPQCCPGSVPFCRDFSPVGIGCFATSAEPTVTTTVGKPFSAFSDTSKSTSRSAAVTVVTLTQTITIHPVEVDSSSRVSAQSSSLLAIESLTTSSGLVTNSSNFLDANTTSIVANGTTITSTVSPTLCFNPDLQAPGPCPSSSSSRSLNPGAAVSTFNPSSLAPKLLSAVPACVGVTVTFTISLVMSVFQCCIPRRKHKDSDGVPGQLKPKIVPGEHLEGKVPRK